MSKAKTIDVTSLPAHPEAAQKGEQTADVAVKEKPISVAVGGKTLTIFSRQTSPQGPAGLTVLLLHGQAFTSSNWQDIGTLQRLALWGHSAVAVDLPGYGNSKEVSLGASSPADFMSALVKTLGCRPVIVSPSMSGGFSLPYLFERPQDGLDRATAYIPVAPVSTGGFTDKYPHSQTPTLIVYGSKDTGLGFASRNHFKALPQGQIAEIPDAGHACYMNQPALFHNLLHHFLSTLAD